MSPNTEEELTSIKPVDKPGTDDASDGQNPGDLTRRP